MCSREKPLVKTMAPGSTFILYKNTKMFISFILFCNLLYYLALQDLILANDHRGDWQPPCLCWVKVFAFVCVGVVHEALRDSPIGSVNLGSHWGKYLSLLYYISPALRGKSQCSSQVAVPSLSGGPRKKKREGGVLPSPLRWRRSAARETIIATIIFINVVVFTNIFITFLTSF